MVLAEPSGQRAGGTTRQVVAARNGEPHGSSGESQVAGGTPGRRNPVMVVVWYELVAGTVNSGCAKVRAAQCVHNNAWVGANPAGTEGR